LKPSIEAISFSNIPALKLLFLFGTTIFMLKMVLNSQHLQIKEIPQTPEMTDWHGLLGLRKRRS